MIEVVPLADGWAFRLISAAGRVLVERCGYPSDGDAILAAKAYRLIFWAHACSIDHRMGACI